MSVSNQQNPLSNTNLPSLKRIMDMVRAICNDSFAGASSTPGEGQILTDQLVVSGSYTTPPQYNPFVVNHLNSAIRELYRRLRNVGDPTLIQDNYVIWAVPVINSPSNGSSNPDPTIQCYLDTGGFFDGTTYWTPASPWSYPAGFTVAQPLYTLPIDCLRPFRLWERQSNTNDTFIPMKRSINGLDPIDQVDRLVEWEWRANKIYFRGATNAQDIRIRYQASFPQFFAPSLNFSTTYVPLIDSEDAIAFLCAKRIAISLGSAQSYQTISAEAESQVNFLKNEVVRNSQNQNFHRKGYGDDDISQDLDQYGI